MDEKPPLTLFRQAHGLTLKGLAERLKQAADIDITEGHLSRVEREGTANFRLALRLAEMTELPVETFAPKDVQTGEAA